MAKKLTADDLWELLKTRYSGDEWVIVSEVRNRAGYDANRTVDAVAMNMWPSRGLRLHGFEIKTSRSDWLRELKEPAKADAFNHLVDFWWLVVSDPAIVREGELPDSWGLLVPRGPGLGVETQATKHEGVDVTRGFLAAMLRRSARELTPDAQIATARREGRVAGMEERKRMDQGLLDQAFSERDEYRDRLVEFEAVIGQTTRGWVAPAGLPESLAIVLAGRVERHRRSLEMAAEQLERVVHDIRAVLPAPE
jgi:hypothetical protein